MTGLTWHQARAAGMHALPDDIVGYTFRADNYCPRCIIGTLPTGDGEPFDGWKLADGVTMSTEDSLSEMATAFGIDRDDERTFDSGHFPKVISRDSASDYAYSEGQPEQCSACGGPLVE